MVIYVLRKNEDSIRHQLFVAERFSSLNVSLGVGIVWNLIADDPDDNKFVECALNAGADYIVTNDKHFNVLKNVDFPMVKVVDIMEFRKMLET